MSLTLSPNSRIFGVLGDLTFLIGHVTSHDHVRKVSNDSIDESPSHLVTALPSLLVIGPVKEEMERV